MDFENIDNRIQYASIEAAIKAHAETYSFNIESVLFPQLTKEQQKLWKKEIEQAYINGGDTVVFLCKPSDEQMEYLSAAIEESNYNPVLESLYNDLKKLREE